MSNEQANANGEESDFEWDDLGLGQAPEFQKRVNNVLMGKEKQFSCQPASGSVRGDAVVAQAYSRPLDNAEGMLVHLKAQPVGDAELLQQAHDAREAHDAKWSQELGQAAKEMEKQLADERATLVRLYRDYISTDGGVGMLPREEQIALHFERIKEDEAKNEALKQQILEDERRTRQAKREFVEAKRLFQLVAGMESSFHDRVARDGDRLEFVDS